MYIYMDLTLKYRYQLDTFNPLPTGRGPGSSQSEALSGKAIPGPVIASVLAVGIIGGLIFLACRMNAPVPATTTSQPPPPAPAPPPPQPTTVSSYSELACIFSLYSLSPARAYWLVSGPQTQMHVRKDLGNRLARKCTHTPVSWYIYPPTFLLGR